MHEPGLFDFADHLERLPRTGDLFEALDRYVDFEVLRPVPTGAPGYGVRPKGRRPSRDPVSMFEFPVPLDDAKRADPEALTKSGSMAGSGEPSTTSGRAWTVHADENFTALKLACPRASANRA